MYRFRSGKLEQLTEDHSLLNECIRAGQLTTQAERDAFPHQNVIVRALGMSDDLKIDFGIHALAKGDVFLLYSDGLSNAVPESELVRLLSRPAEAASEALLQRALDLRAQDNVTVVVAEVQ